MRDEDRALIAGVAYWLTIAVASGLVWWPLSVIAAAVALAAFFGIAQIAVWITPSTCPRPSTTARRRVRPRRNPCS